MKKQKKPMSASHTNTKAQKAMVSHAIPDSKRIAFKTLGCRLNSYETNALISEFIEAGYTPVPFTKKADAYIINSCTVTHQSDQKVRNYINNAGHRKGSGILLLIGCMAKSVKETLLKNPLIDYVVDNDKKASVFHIVDAHFKGESFSENDWLSGSFAYKTARKTPHTRALVKIQDGCNNFCSFCIIPQLRGRAISRPSKDIINNIRELIDAGFKEIVLTGVNISKYRYENVKFEQLLLQILQLEADFRLRISSIEPYDFSEGFYRLFRHPKLTPFLHLCLQSGSETILKNMRREYDINLYFSIVEKLRKIVPDINISTDIMVGFPGENEKDFSDTLHVMNEIKFAHVHSFRFSRRENTLAAKMLNEWSNNRKNGFFPVAEEIKKVRSEKIRALAESHKKLYRNQFIGKQQRILIEKVTGSYASGYSEHYLPVVIKSTKAIRNRFVDVTITGVDAEKLSGEL